MQNYTTFKTVFPTPSITAGLFCMRDYVLLYVNGKRYEIRGEAVFSSLSDFLRCELKLTGTKVVCAEGDCGACTVLVGRLAPEGLRYLTVDACIQFLYQLDCRHVVTVEGLGTGQVRGEIADRCRRSILFNRH